MKELKVSTGNPLDLKREIYGKIDDKKITSWQYDEENDTMYHKGDQYQNHFYFELTIDENKGLLIFKFHSFGTSTFADNKAFYLLEDMLKRHFSDKIDIL